MRLVQVIAPARSAIIAAAFLTHVGVTHATTLCAQLSDLFDDGTSPEATRLQASAAPKIDPSQAEAACLSALKANPTDPNVMFQVGRALALGNKRHEAIKYYLNAADRGHAGAMNDLGGVFEYGVGVPKNFATALAWYERAAQLGHTGAMTHLGKLSEDGVEIPQDFALARHWYEQAAALGNPVAMDNLANVFRRGLGVPPDSSAAATWYRKAAQLSLPSAMNSLGELREHDKDYQSAKSWYQNAADLGNADAMGNLGALFENARVGPLDLDAARAWYVKGAALNGRLAMRNLAAMLENGRGAPQSLSEAKVWYERAAALEYPPALYDLGRLHLEGAGMPKNYVLAKGFFEHAARLGNADAMNSLGVLYLNGRGVPRDLKEARIWFERAMTFGQAEAQENLRRLEDAALTDGPQVAARRAACLQTCASLHRSYVTSMCDRWPATADGDRPERTQCVGMSLRIASQCRDSCREWAFTPRPENSCMACFQAFVACRPANGQIDNNDNSYANYSKDCLAALTDCAASCRRQLGTGAPSANRDKRN
jgi:TPR repeat protein